MEALASEIILEIVNQVIGNALANENTTIIKTTEVTVTESEGDKCKIEGIESHGVASIFVLDTLSTTVQPEANEENVIKKDGIHSIIMLTAEEVTLEERESDGESRNLKLPSNDVTESSQTEPEAFESEIEGIESHPSILELDTLTTTVQSEADEDEENVIENDEIHSEIMRTAEEFRLEERESDGESRNLKLSSNDIAELIPRHNEKTNKLETIDEAVDENYEILLSSEKEIQLIDHFDVEIGSAELMTKKCDDEAKMAQIANNLEMNHGEDKVFQETEKNTELKPRINESVSHSSGTKLKPVNNNQISATIGSGKLGDDFYNNELLCRKGFTLAVNENDRTLTNLSLFSNVNNFCQVNQVLCKNMPHQMMLNHLVPLFEKAGAVLELRMVLNNENRERTHVYVTYTTQKDAENAKQTLNRANVQGHVISVVRYIPDCRIFVKGIPTSATKNQLLHRFGLLTAGLKSVMLMDSNIYPGENRGFCVLGYIDYWKAYAAKELISKIRVLGKNLTCNWSRCNNEDTSETLFISNIRPGLHSSDLRKIFSIYGHVNDIDKSVNRASVAFSNWKDAQRASRAIDKKLLGDKNVKISLTNPWKKFEYEIKSPQTQPTVQRKVNKKPNASRSTLYEAPQRKERAYKPTESNVVNHPKSKSNQY